MRLTTILVIPVISVVAHLSVVLLLTTIMYCCCNTHLKHTHNRHINNPTNYPYIEQYLPKRDISDGQTNDTEPEIVNDDVVYDYQDLDSTAVYIIPGTVCESSVGNDYANVEVRDRISLNNVEVVTLARDINDDHCEDDGSTYIPIL